MTVVAIVALIMMGLFARALYLAMRELEGERHLADSFAADLAEIQQILADFPIGIEQVNQARCVAGNVSAWFEARGLEPE
jgi:hypothetical protein